MSPRVSSGGARVVEQKSSLGSVGGLGTPASRLSTVSPRSSYEESRVDKGEARAKKTRSLSPQSPRHSRVSPEGSQKKARLVLESSKVQSLELGGGGSKVTECCEFGVTVKPTLVNKGSQKILQQSRDFGTDPLPPAASASRSTQLCSVLGQKDKPSQTQASKQQDEGTQAFEEDPWQCLLSEEKVCELIQVDQLVGLGIDGKPNAKLENHDISCQRVLSQGVIYQVVVLKEQYVIEKEVRKEIVVVEEKKSSKLEKVVADKETTKKTDKVQVIEIDLELEKPEEEHDKSVDSKDFLVVKEEEVVEVDRVELVEDLASFKEKPWLNLRQKIIDKQSRKTPDPVPDSRTPYQLLTEEPQAPGPVPLEINSHIRLALQDVQEFLQNKSVSTSGFLPLAVSKKIMDQYRTYLEPGFSLDPEIAVQLEGLLSGTAFSGVSKKSVPFSIVELEKVALSSFNVVEIMSFMMAAIAVINGGLTKVESKIKGPALATLAEYKPFLGSLDKACRHVVKESLALMVSFMIKQRQALSSCLSVSLPKSFRSKVIRAPITSFEVAPKEAFREIKEQYDSFIQSKAFAQAVANLGAKQFRGTTRIFKKKTMVIARGTRARGQSFRGSLGNRGFRGQGRGTLRGVKRIGLGARNLRAFARRDRAIGRGQDNQPRDTETGEFSGQSHR